MTNKENSIKNFLKAILIAAVFGAVILITFNYALTNVVNSATETVTVSEGYIINKEYQNSVFGSHYKITVSPNKNDNDTTAVFEIAENDYKTVHCGDYYDHGDIINSESIQ